MASASSEQQSNMIIEGFICPECQQDMSSIEHLQAHFELVHSKKSSGHHAHSDGKIRHVLAKAKTLLSDSEPPSI